jgi:hypothetical protein
MLVRSGGRLFIIPRLPMPYVRVSGPLSRAVVALLGGQKRDVVLKDLVVSGEPAAEAVLSAAEALIARHSLADLGARAPASPAGHLVTALGGALTMASAILCISFLAAQSAAALDSGGFPLSVATLGWLLFAVPSLVLLHELAHLLVARLFGVAPSTVGFDRGKTGLPMPWLDLREAWDLAPRDHALIHLAGPACDLVLTGLAVLMLWAMPGPIAPLQAVALAGALFLMANLNPFGRSDLVSACRAALGDPDYGPCRWQGVGLFGPPGLKRMTRVYVLLLAVLPVLLCLVFLGKILR